MHTTTKKNLGRSTRAGVVGRSFVSSPLCAHRTLLTRIQVYHVWELWVCPRVLLWQRVVQTRVYQRGTLLPWTRSKLPVRHFVSAILFARYLVGYFDLDALRSLRYLFACMPTYADLVYYARMLRDEPADIGAPRFRRDATLRHPRENYFSRSKLQAYGLTSHERCQTNLNGLSYMTTKRRGW